MGGQIANRVAGRNIRTSAERLKIRVKMLPLGQIRKPPRGPVR